ncbi:MAG: tetratricopeptide repeat protein [Bacteroidota bacterium]
MLNFKYLKTLLRHNWLLALLLAMSSLSGCFVSDFVSRRYDNSVAYFNTYYNATRLFDDAVLEIQTTEQTQKSKGLPPQKEISPTAKQKLTSVIEKCSKLLQYHPTSKWVADALMLIGESYYYMGDYLKADRKFAELVAQFPESNRFLEARLWLGKSLRRSGQLEPATRELSAVADAASAASEKAIAAQAWLELGEIYTDKEAYDGAIKAYQDLIDKSDYDELKAEAQFRLAQLDEKASDYQKAADAFRKVLDFDPDPYLRYQSRFRYAVNKERLKNYDEALRFLYALLNERSNTDFYPEIKLEIANALNASGELENAIEAYAIVDTTYRKTDVAAKGYFQLGFLYEKTLHNYAAAETNYVRASTEFATSEVAPLGREHGENLRRYLLSRRMITESDSSLVTEMKRLEKGRDTAKVHQPDSLKAEQQDSLKVHRPDSLKAQQPDSFKVQQPGFVRMQRPDSLKVQQLDSLKVQRPDSLSDSLAVKLRPPWQLHTELWDSTAISPTIRALKLQLAKQAYDLAVLFFLDLDEPDSALYWCEKTTSLSADSDLSSRGLYTLAEIHRTINSANRASVDSLYKKIISEYPNTEYGREAQRILGVDVKKVAVDSAGAVYRRGEQLLGENRPGEAINTFQTIVREFPTSPYSPKSQYAIGWIYENVEDKPDSAAASYRTLANRYPTSTYANAVMPMLAARDQWKAESKLKRDSTSTDSLKQKKGTGVAPQNLPTTSVIKDSTARVDTLKNVNATPSEELNNEARRRSQRMKADSTRKIPD